MHVRKTEICKFALGSALQVHERHEAKKVSRREHRIHEAASWIDLWNQAPFVKTFCVWGIAWPSLLVAHLQNCLQRKGDISKHLRKHTIRSGLSSPSMRKVTFAWTLGFLVLLWYDWTGGQSSEIGKQHSQLHIIGKGGTQCRLPRDFPIKSGSWIYFINMGICWLMRSWKLYCVPDFDDFCSWKCIFFDRHVWSCQSSPGGSLYISYTRREVHSILLAQHLQKLKHSVLLL